MSEEIYNPGSAFTQSQTRVFNPTILHYGIDYGAHGVENIAVLSAADGKVIYSGVSGNNLNGKAEGGVGYGNTVIIEHIGADGKKFYTLYGHLDGDYMPEVGGTITKGAKIGEAGNTGGSAGIHLHFEVIRKDDGSQIPFNKTGRIGIDGNQYRQNPATFTNWPSTGVYNSHTTSFLDWQTGGSNAEDVASVTGLSSGDICIDSEPIADNSDGLPAGLKYYIKDKTTGEILGTYKPTGEGSFEVVMGDVKTVQSSSNNNGIISIERERYCKDEQGNFQLYDKASYTDLVDRTTVKSFDSQGNLLAETNEYKIDVGLRLAGSREDTTYDTNGDIKSWEVNNPDGSSYCYTNLGEGKYSEITLNANGSWNSVTYDAIGNTLSESTSIKSDNIWTETYTDYVNNFVTVKDSNVNTGNTIESVYSLNGTTSVLVSSTTTTQLAGGGVSTVKTDGLEHVIYEDILSADGSCLYTEYDTAGNIIITKQFNTDGSYVNSTYDANGHLVTEEGADSDCIGYTKEYNPDGTLATMTQTSEGTSLLRTTMDDLGNFITVIIPSLISDGLSLIYDTINSIPTYVEDIGTAVWNTVTDVGNYIGDLIGLNTNPIGAFYEATTPANDNAASIANLTGRIMLNNEAISKDELDALDTNHDGKITSADTNFSALTVWQDINEDGKIDAGENKTLTQADITSIKSEDYKYFTSGNGEDKADLIAQPDKITPSSTEPTIDFNHYRNEVDLSYSFGMVAVYTNHIADSQGYYTCTSYGSPLAYNTNDTVVVNGHTYRFLTSVQSGSVENKHDWTANQIKVSQDRTTMTGTDGIDEFGTGYYSDIEGSGVIRMLGGGGNDLLIGNSQNNQIWGGTGNDELQGGDGNDTLAGEENNDRIFGQTGDDIIFGGSGNDFLQGFTGSNDTKQTLETGETDNDEISGGGGDDTILGGLGNDKLFGGEGIDGIDGNEGNDYIDGGDGDDYFLGGGQGDDTVFGGIGIDELHGGDGNDILDGEAGNDKIFGETGDDVIYGGDGDDILAGFTANNATKQSLLPGETDNDVIYGGSGIDIILGGVGDDIAFGGIGNDHIEGGYGNDRLYGDAGNDVLFGQTGNDIMYGGEGDDLLIGFTAGDEEKQTLATGESDNDYLYGGAGKDILLGRVGNDYLDGGAGADTMEGGAGDDTYIVNSVNDVILERKNEGYDTVLSSSNYLLNAEIEELKLLGSESIHGTGNSRDNRIIGNSGSNILDGVTGADTMIGQEGNDIYYVDNVGDTVVELATQGNDTVQSSISYTLGENVENLTLLSYQIPEQGLVDGQDVLVFGYPKRYELDYMQGNAVPDYLGTCALTSISNLLTQAEVEGISEEAVVRYAIENQLATTTATNPTATPAQLGGSNYIQQMEILSDYGIKSGLIVGYNAEFIADRIREGRGVLVGVNAGILWDAPAYVGTGGVNHLITVSGVVCDKITGEITGFYICDSGRQKVSDMTRYVSLADLNAAAGVSSAYTLYTQDTIKLWDTNINGTGNELDNIIIGTEGNNILDGKAGNDTLVGEYGFDTLYGGEGNDYLDGGAGADTMSGGAGNDIYVVDDAGDMVSEIEGEGTDKVLSSISYTLIDNVENLDLTGTSDINGTGNALDNILTGNTGNNVLDGGAGADTMSGGMGDDTYVVDNASDVVLESTDEGTDKVQSAISYTLGTNVENLDLTGSSDINGTGNELANILQGNSGNNVLDGGAGDDAIFGGDGDDDLRSGGGNDMLLGEGGIDILRGSSGADMLDGGTEADTLSGGRGSDTYIFRRGSGNDMVIDESICDATEDAGLNDRVVFEGLNLIDVEFRKEGNNLIAKIIDTGEELTITNHFNEYSDNIYNNRIENFEFEGGVVSFAEIPIIIPGTPGDDLLIGTRWNDIIDGLSGNDAIYGLQGDDQLIGGTGDDYLDGGAGADTMSGGLGDDKYIVDDAGDVVTELAGEGIDKVNSAIDYTLGVNVENLDLTGSSDISGTGNELANILNGNTGNNVLDGGAGADTMSGGTGNDTYVFTRTSGLDAISETSGIDSIRFEGVNVKDAEFSRVGDDLVIKLDGLDADVLTVTSHFLTGDANKIENFIFDDWSIDNLNFGDDDGSCPWDGGGTSGNDLMMVYGGGDVIWGNAGNDVIHGGSGDDILRANGGSDMLLGEAGNDILAGSGGTDILDGGTENDTMYGAMGNDTYIFRSGSGNDVVYEDYPCNPADAGTNDKIVFEGLNSNEVEFRKEGNNLIAKIINTGETLTITDQFRDFGTNAFYRRIEQFQFNDGTFAQNNLDIHLYGGTGNDYISGLAGNDTLIGGTGNDAYSYNLGWGSDTIEDAGNDCCDKLQINGLAGATQLDFEHIGNDLVIKLNGAESLRITDQFEASGADKVENFKMIVGTQQIDFTSVNLDAIISAMSTADQNNSVPVTMSAFMASGSAFSSLINVTPVPT